MAISADEIIRAALELSEEERSMIAGQLLESLDDLPGLGDDAEDFQEELERRSGDLDGAISWETLRDEQEDH